MERSEDLGEEDVEAAQQLLDLIDLPLDVVKTGVNYFIFLQFNQCTSDVTVTNKRGRPSVTPDTASERTIRKAYTELNLAIKDGMFSVTIISSLIIVQLATTNCYSSTRISLNVALALLGY